MIRKDIGKQKSLAKTVNMTTNVDGEKATQCNY
jgi:hypothetical protein